MTTADHATLTPSTDKILADVVDRFTARGHWLTDEQRLAVPLAIGDTIAALDVRGWLTEDAQMALGIGAAADVDETAPSADVDTPADADAEVTARATAAIRAVLNGGAVSLDIYALLLLVAERAIEDERRAAGPRP